MPMNTTYLSGQTTRFTSDVSVDASTLVATAVVGALGQFTTLINSSSQIGNVASFNSITIGAGPLPITLISASSTTLVATTAVATKSTETNVTNNLVKIGDIITWGLGTSTSSLSAGLALDMFVSAVSTITIRLSNCSTANAAQPAISLVYKAERFQF